MNLSFGINLWGEAEDVAPIVNNQTALFGDQTNVRYRPVNAVGQTVLLIGTPSLISGDSTGFTAEINDGGLRFGAGTGAPDATVWQCTLASGGTVEITVSEQTNSYTALPENPSDIQSKGSAAKTAGASTDWRIILRDGTMAAFDDSSGAASGLFGGMSDVTLFTYAFATKWTFNGTLSYANADVSRIEDYVDAQVASHTGGSLTIEAEHTWSVIVPTRLSFQSFKGLELKGLKCTWGPKFSDGRRVENGVEDSTPTWANSGVHAQIVALGSVADDATIVISNCRGGNTGVPFSDTGGVRDETWYGDFTRASNCQAIIQDSYINGFFNLLIGGAGGKAGRVIRSVLKGKIGDGVKLGNTISTFGNTQDIEIANNFMDQPAAHGLVANFHADVTQAGTTGAKGRCRFKIHNNVMLLETPLTEMILLDESGLGTYVVNQNTLHGTSNTQGYRDIYAEGSWFINNFSTPSASHSPTWDMGDGAIIANNTIVRTGQFFTPYQSGSYTPAAITLGKSLASDTTQIVRDNIAEAYDLTANTGTGAVTTNNGAFLPYGSTLQSTVVVTNVDLATEFTGPFDSGQQGDYVDIADLWVTNNPDTLKEVASLRAAVLSRMQARFTPKGGGSHAGQGFTTTYVGTPAVPVQPTVSDHGVALVDSPSATGDKLSLSFTSVPVGVTDIEYRTRDNAESGSALSWGAWTAIGSATTGPHIITVGSSVTASDVQIRFVNVVGRSTPSNQMMLRAITPSVAIAEVDNGGTAYTEASSGMGTTNAETNVSGYLKFAIPSSGAVTGVTIGDSALRCFVQANSTGTVSFTFKNSSNTTVSAKTTGTARADGLQHEYWFRYNGSAGTFTLFVDGTDVTGSLVGAASTTGSVDMSSTNWAAFANVFGSSKADLVVSRIAIWADALDVSDAGVRTSMSDTTQRASIGGGSVVDLFGTLAEWNAGGGLNKGSGAVYVPNGTFT